MNLSCDTLAVSRSGYYAWRDRPECARAKQNSELVKRIRVVHAESEQTYGSPRIQEVLAAEGFSCGKNRVARLMRKHGVASEAVKKFKIMTTDSNHNGPIADRIFETEHADAVMAPNQVWSGDITYIATGEGWLFLAVFLDLFTRKIVGFSMDDNMRVSLVLEALEMGLGRQDVVDGEMIAHTDRGSQFAAEDYRKRLDEAGIVASMSRRGNCYDNAHVESFFSYAEDGIGSTEKNLKADKKLRPKSFGGSRPGTTAEDSIHRSAIGHQSRRYLRKLWI